MTRPVARHPSAVQAEKSLLPIPSGVSSNDARESLSAFTTPWYWRMALFLWVTSFVFLLLYELLAGIIKAW